MHSREPPILHANEHAKQDLLLCNKEEPSHKATTNKPASERGQTSLRPTNKPAPHDTAESDQIPADEDKVTTTKSVPHDASCVSARGLRGRSGGPSAWCSARTASTTAGTTLTKHSVDGGGGGNDDDDDDGEATLYNEDWMDDDDNDDDSDSTMTTVGVPDDGDDNSGGDGAQLGERGHVGDGGGRERKGSVVPPVGKAPTGGGMTMTTATTGAAGWEEGRPTHRYGDDGGQAQCTPPHCDVGENRLPRRRQRPASMEEASAAVADSDDAIGGGKASGGKTTINKRRG